MGDYERLNTVDFDAEFQESSFMFETSRRFHVSALFLGILFSLVFPACSSGPQLKDYPRRDIDRPFTLPEGVATWSTLGYYAVEKYDFDGTPEEDHSTIPAIPLVWRTSLSEKWNLIWAPIPVAVLYQIRSDESATTGLILDYGLKISSNGYSAGSLRATYSHRQKLSSHFALELAPRLAPWFPLGREAKWDLQSSVSFGPFFQVNDVFSLRAGSTVFVRRDPQTVISGSFFRSDFDIHTEYHWRAVLPLYAGFNWSLSRQWDLAGNVEYHKIGEHSGYSNLQVGYELRHYW